MIYTKNIWFYDVICSITLPIDEATKRDGANITDDYDSKQMKVGEKIVVDDTGVWARSKGMSFEYIKLNITQKFLEINCPKIFMKIL